MDKQENPQLLRQEITGIVQFTEQEGGYAAPAIDIITPDAMPFDSYTPLENLLRDFDGKNVRITIEVITKENDHA